MIPSNIDYRDYVAETAELLKARHRRIIQYMRGNTAYTADYFADVLTVLGNPGEVVLIVRAATAGTVSNAEIGQALRDVRSSIEKAEEMLGLFVCEPGVK